MGAVASALPYVLDPLNITGVQDMARNARNPGPPPPMTGGPLPPPPPPKPMMATPEQIAATQGVQPELSFGVNSALRQENDMNRRGVPEAAKGFISSMGGWHPPTKFGSGQWNYEPGKGPVWKTPGWGNTNGAPPKNRI